MSESPLAAALREPAHQVSPNAKKLWRTTTGIEFLVTLAVAVTVMVLVPERPWWAWLLAVALVALDAVHMLVMPPLRYRIHRWEVSEEAVFTRSGWISTHQRIAPLSRVQTVDSRQGALMRLFDLMSVTVTTASAAGPIVIECLDTEVARRVIADLTERTAAVEGDAT